jgi:hypothetical protein
MTKLFFAKLLKNLPYVVLSNTYFRKNNILLLLPDELLYYLALHLKFSTSERSTQLVELFAYENPLSTPIHTVD